MNAHSSSCPRLRILLSAYACEPNKGSEPAVGWQSATTLAQHHEVWVITRANNRPTIERALKQSPHPNLHFVYYDLPGWMSWWKRGGRGVQLYYYLWQLLSATRVRKLEADQRFDVVHHVTIVRYWSPSNLRVSRAPFLWGPVGGGEDAPRSFRRSFAWRHRVIEQCRRWIRRLAELDPWVKQTAQAADIALATTAETATRLRALGVARVEVMSQLGLDHMPTILQRSIEAESSSQTLRFLCVGRWLYWKGFDLAIRAFARMPFSEARLTVVGAGPESGRLKALARATSVADRIDFREWLSPEETQAEMAACDVLVHPSLHDSGGFVCLEAMAQGKPVVCLNLGGPALLVTHESGCKIDAAEPDQTVNSLAEAMQRLAEDRAQRHRMGQASRSRVEQEFLWARKIERWESLYSSLIDDATPAAETSNA